MRRCDARFGTHTNMHEATFWYSEHMRRKSTLRYALSRAGLLGAHQDDQRTYLRTYRMRVRVLTPVRSVA